MILTALFVMSVCFAQSAAIDEFMLDYCVPHKENITTCFKSLLDLHDPNFLDPLVAGLDGKKVGNVTTFKTRAYQFKQFELNPVFMCMHMEQYLSSISCLEEEARKECPFLLDGLFDKKKLEDAFSYLCSEMKNMKMECVQSNPDQVDKCQKEVYPEYYTDWDEDWLEEGNHTTNSTDSFHSGDKKDDGDSKRGYHVVDSEESSKIWTEEEKIMDTQCNWDDIFGRGSTVDLWDMLFCYEQYTLIKCIARPIASCDQYTADVMVNFMKMQESPKCAKMIDECKALKSPKCSSKTCGAAAYSVTAAAMSLPVLLAMERMMSQ